LNASSSPQNIVSVSITTTGNAVRVVAYGDAENTGAGYWAQLQLYRDSTALGAMVHTEGSAGSENSPFALDYIDNPAAGTYTYYLKANQISGGTINFGESTAPIINVQELNGSGSSGTSGSSGSSGTSGTSGIGVSGSSGSSGTSGTSPSGLVPSNYVAQGYLLSNQSIPSNSDTVIQFIDDFDPQNWWNTSI